MTDSTPATAAQPEFIEEAVGKRVRFVVVATLDRVERHEWGVIADTLESTLDFREVVSWEVLDG